MISIIAAVAKNGVIGRGGRLPWHLPEDLRHFYKLTVGHTVVMGRKTFESIGKPLSKRRNIIMTRDKNYKAEGCETLHSVSEVIEKCQDDEVFVIGGEQIFREFMPLADRLYLTRVHKAVKGDTFFPEIDLEVWQLKERSEVNFDPGEEVEYRFEVYWRKAS